MIGLCEVNWGGCHEGERNELMPALTLGRGVEQNFQRVKRNPDKRPDWNLVPRAGAAGRPAMRQRHKERRTKPIWNRSKAWKHSNLSQKGPGLRGGNKANSVWSRAGNRRAGHAAPDLRIVQVLRKSQVIRAGERVTVHSEVRFSPG